MNQLAKNTKNLRYIIAVADCGSFRRAANALSVQQSSVSRAIAKLEDELGVSLFERRFSGVCLTNAGKHLLSQIRPALDQIDMARTMAAAAGRAELGTVSVGILTSLAGGFLRDLVRCYAKRHPDVMIDIRDGCCDEHIAAVRSRALDLAFVTGNLRVKECDTSTLWEERVHVALPTGHRLAGRSHVDWSDLRSETFILSRHTPGPQVSAYIRNRWSEGGVYPEIVFKLVTQETLMNLVALGQGITIIAAPWTAVKLPDLVLRPLADPADVVTYSAVWSPQNDNPALSRFLSVAHVLAGRVRRGASE